MSFASDRSGLRSQDQSAGRLAGRCPKKLLSQLFAFFPQVPAPNLPLKKNTAPEPGDVPTFQGSFRVRRFQELFHVPPNDPLTAAHFDQSSQQDTSQRSHQLETNFDSPSEALATLDALHVPSPRCPRQRAGHAAHAFAGIGIMKQLLSLPLFANDSIKQIITIMMIVIIIIVMKNHSKQVFTCWLSARQCPFKTTCSTSEFKPIRSQRRSFRSAAELNVPLVRCFQAETHHADWIGQKSVPWALNPAPKNVGTLESRG